MPPQAKEKGVGIRAFIGKEDNSQEVRKSNCFIKKCFSCYAETMEHREDFEQTDPAKRPTPITPGPYSL